MNHYQILQGDCREQMKSLPDNSVDSIVTDPPYELGFMSKSWDSTGVAYDVNVWKECLRVLKPGGHIIAFSGSRTYHRMAVAIEDAGFQIRDQIMWVYGSGFPKSHNISKALDKMAGVEREVVGMGRAGKNALGQDSGWNKTNNPDQYEITKSKSPEAKQWEGWGTALKPAHEPMVLARKPLEGTVAENVLKWGVGGLNIDGCRVSAEGENFDNVKDRTDMIGKLTHHHEGGNLEALDKLKRLGRFPANFIHDGSQEVLDLFPETKSGALNAGHKQGSGMFGAFGGETILRNYGNDSGSAARFFYCPKASRKDRNEGCEDFDDKPPAYESHRANYKNTKGVDTPFAGAGKGGNFKNNHPTVKPTELMRYLCRLITPTNGTVLDPFTGSGSTGKACMLEGFNFIGCELSEDYIKIAEARIKSAQIK